jgi:type IV secretion system protein VirB10
MRGPDEKEKIPRSPQFAESSDGGGKRMLGPKIISFGILILVVVLLFVFMALNSERDFQERTASRQRGANMSDATTLRDSLIAAAEADRFRTVEPETPPAPEAVPEIQTSPPAPPATIIVVQPREPRAPRVLTEEEREAARRYRDTNRESITSKSGVSGFEELNRGTSSSSPSFSPSPSRDELMMRYLEAQGNDSAQGGAQGDVNAFQHKLDFLTKDGAARTPQDYSSNTRVPPISPMELKAGTVIPGLLLVGVNSDLPGMVVGQVSENVYDTATGRYMLIPQGTRIIGVYDSRITYGQKRVSVVWNRLVYPDGSSLNIAGSPGTDMAGYSGIRGRVNNHYGQLLSAALFTSFFTAAIDIASGGSVGNSNSNESKSAKDILAETTATTIAGVGARLAERALDIQPTIVIKPGTRFNVMVTQDVAFLSPWTQKSSRVAGF